jgi:hypothetical protein
MASLWDEQISDSHHITSVKENWLHSKKKTYGYCQRDEEKRQAFAGQLSTIPPEKIVYLDESGMDSLHQYDYGWNSLWSALPCPQIRSAPGTGEHNCCLVQPKSDRSLHY